MNDLPRQKLSDLVAQYGPSLCDDPRRCEALLRDFCGEHRREVFILTSALREQVVADLRTSHKVDELLLSRFARRLQDNLGVTDEAARWAVESWARALGRMPANAPRTAPATVRISRTSGPTITVSASGQGDQRTISAAIRSAPAGACITVQPGYYRESLVIDKPLDIIGEGTVDEIVLESDREPCVRLRADHARIHGLTLCFRSAHGSKRFAAVDVAQGHLVLEDCDITSAALSCVLVHGVTAHATLSRCRVHHGKECGVFIVEGGTATLEDCSIFRNTLSGVQVKQGSLFMKRCQVHDQAAHGVAIQDNGQATLEDCAIFGNGAAGIAISKGARPIIRRSQIRDGKDVGILVMAHGQGTLEECDISGNAAAGIVIQQGGAPLIRHCQIHHQAKHYGVHVREHGKGRLEDCDIFANGLAGVGIGREGQIIVRACRVHHHARHNGIHIFENGQGTIEDCTIVDNAFAGVEVSADSRFNLRHCQVQRNGTVAVRVCGSSRGSLENCDLSGNTIGACNIDPDCSVTARENKE